MMRVAIIGIKGLPARGGAERVVEAIVRRITSKGVAPTVYCDARYTPPDFSIEGVRMIRIHTIPGKHLRSLTLALFSALHAVLSGNYDLVHLHNIEASFILPVLRLRFRVLGTAHGFAYWRSKWGRAAKRIMMSMDYFFMRFSNMTSSVSAKDARSLQRRFGRQVLYIPNGVGTEFNADLDAAEEILNKHGIRRRRYFIFTAGRIEPTKGAHLAVEAVTRLDRGVPLLVVGDAGQVHDYEEKLHNIAGSMVYFQPLIEEPSVLFGLMKYSVCLIFPSLVEAMSMVLLEAASLGIPVISSDIEENREVLGEDGIYFRSGDVGSLMEKLGWILDNQADAGRKAADLQKLVHSRYSWDRIADRYFEVYRQVAA
ncbi:MAG: glycosyltransferase family 4 protein [Deferribacteres bacterium]|nr:glycosyltransferase family 4 protein [Deferribacteres bacterium]